MLNRSFLSRALPFAAYILFLMIEDLLGKFFGVSAENLRWVYPAKTLVVLGLLIYFWKDYDELRQRMDGRGWLLGLLVGIVIFVIWINASMPWMLTGSSNGFDPRGAQGGLDWFFVIVRVAGAALVVPVMEELFFRSLLMRWLVNPDFRKVEPNQVSLTFLLIVSAIFAVEHVQWFAGLLAGLAYGYLYMYTRNLWSPILAHGITNGVLAIWVLQTGNWNYW